MVSSRCTILLALLGLAFTLASAIRTPEAVQGKSLASIEGEARLEELADTASGIAGSQRNLLVGLSLERWLFGTPAPAKKGKKGKKTKKPEPEEEEEEEATEEEDGGDEKEEKEEGGDEEGGDVEGGGEEGVVEAEAKPAEPAVANETKLTDNKGVEFAEGSLSAMVAAKFGPGQFVHHNTPGSCEDLKAKSDHCRSRAKNKNQKRGCRGMQIAAQKCYEARVDTMIEQDEPKTGPIKTSGAFDPLG